MSIDSMSPEELKQMLISKNEQMIISKNEIVKELEEKIKEIMKANSVASLKKEWKAEDIKSSLLYLFVERKKQPCLSITKDDLEHGHTEDDFLSPMCPMFVFGVSNFRYTESGLRILNPKVLSKSCLIYDTYVVLKFISKLDIRPESHFITDESDKSWPCEYIQMVGNILFTGLKVSEVLEPFLAIEYMSNFRGDPKRSKIHKFLKSFSIEDIKELTSDKISQRLDLIG